MLRNVIESCKECGKNEQFKFLNSLILNRFEGMKSSSVINTLAILIVLIPFSTIGESVHSFSIHFYVLTLIYGGLNGVAIVFLFGSLLLFLVYLVKRNPLFNKFSIVAFNFSFVSQVLILALADTTALLTFLIYLLFLIVYVFHCFWYWLKYSKF